MAYFSRLTDIVTCNLTRMLHDAADPSGVLEQIIGEMEEGLAGAQRSAATASGHEERFRAELAEHQQQMEQWAAQARQALEAGQEDEARLALYRKSEFADVVAGLEQQLEAAVATREHLTTTLRAIRARLADARRRLQQLQTSPEAPPTDSTPSNENLPLTADHLRQTQIEEELEQLKQQLGKA